MHDQSKPSLAELAHSGVKGMKWGVRKGYVERKTRAANAALKVAGGNGTFKDRRQSGFIVGKNNNLKFATQTLDHTARLKSGNTKTTDLLKLYGSFTLLDIKRQPVNYGKAK